MKGLRGNAGRRDRLYLRRSQPARQACKHAHTSRHTQRWAHMMHRGGHIDLQAHTMERGHTDLQAHIQRGARNKEVGAPIYRRRHRQAGKGKTQEKASDLKAMFRQNHTKLELRKKER